MCEDFHCLSYFSTTFHAKYLTYLEYGVIFIIKAAVCAGELNMALNLSYSRNQMADYAMCFYKLVDKDSVMLSLHLVYLAANFANLANCDLH